MAKLSLYIADVDESFVVGVLEAVAHAPSVQVVGYARDGCTALRQIQALHPNVVLSDVQLPGMDGIALIQQVCRMNRPPLCIACTRFYSDTALEAARQFGAAYFLYKPIDFGRLPGIVTRCWETCRRNAAQERPERAGGAQRLAIGQLREMLMELGFPVRRNGSLYAVEAMLRLQDDPMLLKNLSKGLYAALAEGLQTTPSGIERSLRSAIASAYERGALSEAFPARPSNRAFIEYLQRRMEEAEPLPATRAP